MVLRSAIELWFSLDFTFRTVMCQVHTLWVVVMVLFSAAAVAQEADSGGAPMAPVDVFATTSGGVSGVAAALVSATDSTGRFLVTVDTQSSRANVFDAGSVSEDTIPNTGNTLAGMGPTFLFSISAAEDTRFQQPGLPAVLRIGAYQVRLVFPVKSGLYTVSFDESVDFDWERFVISVLSPVLTPQFTYPAQNQNTTVTITSQHVFATARNSGPWGSLGEDESL